METGFDLKQYLAGQVAEGVVDSHGAFTVAREKALKKLAHFGLPGEYHWVLKIVQAANIWRVPKLQVRQSRVATSFFMCPPKGQRFPSESAIVLALDSPVLDKDDPVHQLAMALRSLVQQASLSFVLAVREHGELGKPIFAGDDASAMDADTRSEWTHLDREGIRLTVSHFRGDESLTGRYIPTFSRLVKRHTLIAAMLERRCFSSTVPIELDGRLVSTVFPSGSYDQDRLHRPLVVGNFKADEANGYAVDRFDLLSARIPKQRLAVCASHENEEKPWFLLRAPEVHAVGEIFRILDVFVAGPADMKTLRHTFSWVRQGVVVARFSFHTSAEVGLSLSFFFPAAHLRTDLSGLQIELESKAPPPTEAVMAALKSHLSSILREGELAELLLKEPELPASKGAADNSERPEDQLEQAGRSVLTQSIAFKMPSVNTHAMVVLDKTSALLGRAVFPQHTLLRWVDHVQRGLGELLLADLGRAQAMGREELD